MEDRQYSGEQLTRIHALRMQIGANPTRVKIDGKTFTMFVEDMTFDEVALAGGQGDQGGFRAMIPIPDCPERPAELAGIEARGKQFAVLNVVDLNGVAWQITAGDPVGDET